MTLTATHPTTVQAERLAERHVPATGGSYVVVADTFGFPYATVAAVVDGTPAVLFELHTPVDRPDRHVALTLTVDEARHLIDALSDPGDNHMVRAAVTAGAIWVAVMNGVAGVLLIDRDDVREVSAQFRRHELAAIVAGLEAAVEAVAASSTFDVTYMKFGPDGRTVDGRVHSGQVVADEHWRSALDGPDRFVALERLLLGDVDAASVVVTSAKQVAS